MTGQLMNLFGGIVGAFKDGFGKISGAADSLWDWITGGEAFDRPGKGFKDMKTAGLSGSAGAVDALARFLEADKGWENLRNNPFDPTAVDPFGDVVLPDGRRLSRSELAALLSQSAGAEASLQLVNGPEGASLRDVHRNIFYEPARQRFDQDVRNHGRTLVSKDEVDGYVRNLLTGGVQWERKQGEGLTDYRNRVLSEVRAFSEKMQFADNNARRAHIALVGALLGDFYRAGGPAGLTYGVDGGPTGYNPITPNGVPDIDKGMVDCTQFTSMVLYGAGVTYGKMTEADVLFNMKNWVQRSGRNRISNNPFAINEGSEGNRGTTQTFDYDHRTIQSEAPWRKGATNHRANTELFVGTPMNMPLPGSIGVQIDAEGHSTHAFVVLGAGTDPNTLRIAESAGGTGVRIVPDYRFTQGSSYEFYQIRPTFNRWQLK